jgi:hypothetical protein
MMRWAAWRGAIVRMLRRLIWLERELLTSWLDDMWRSLNIVGKGMFLPVTLFGLIVLPVIGPIMWCLLALLARDDKETMRHPR